MTTLNPRDVVVRYVQAVAEGDLDIINASFADEATWTYPGDLPLSGTWKGRTAIVQDFLTGAAGGLFQPGGEPEITLTNVITEGTTVVAEWTARGTAATGRPYDNRCLGIFTVHEGLITSVVEYTDTRHAAQALFDA